MKSMFKLNSLIGEIPVLEKTAEGLLKGGFTAFNAPGEGEARGSDTQCISNTKCELNSRCGYNLECTANDGCYDDKACSGGNNPSCTCPPLDTLNDGMSFKDSSMLF